MLKSKEILLDDGSAWAYSYDVDIQILKWVSKENKMIQKNECIALIKIEDKEVNLKCPMIGKIIKLNQNKEIPRNTQIFQIVECDHPIVVLFLCGKCGQKINQKSNNEMKQLPGQRDNQNIKLNEEKAQQIENKILQKLDDQKKLILILDLDNTLLHTSEMESYEEQEDIYKLHQKENIKFVTKLRPYLDEFFKQLHQIYEIYIYTMGDRNYAEQICKILNQRFKSKMEYQILNDKIISRNDNVKYGQQINNLNSQKSIENLFPYNKSKQLILDDRQDVWEYCDNIIPTLPYHYFKQNQQNDSYLYYVTKYLTNIHQMYFQNQNADIRQLNKFLLSTQFQNYNIVFSGILNKDQKLEDMDIYHLALKHGAMINNDFKEGKKNVLLTVKDRVTSKIKNAKQNNIPILHINWLIMSINYLHILDYQHFNIQDTDAYDVTKIEKKIKMF